MSLTKFQEHVLKLLHALGPIDYAGLQVHCHHPRKAVKKAVYRLRVLGLSRRIAEDSFDVTNSGKRLNRANFNKKEPTKLPFSGIS